MKKFATYAGIALLVWWVIQDPTAAAHLVHAIGGAFSRAAGSVSTLTSSANSLPWKDYGYGDH